MVPGSDFPPLIQYYIGVDGYEISDLHVDFVAFLVAGIHRSLLCSPVRHQRLAKIGISSLRAYQWWSCVVLCIATVVVCSQDYTVFALGYLIFGINLMYVCDEPNGAMVVFRNLQIYNNHLSDDVQPSANPRACCVPTYLGKSCR